MASASASTDPPDDGSPVRCACRVPKKKPSTRPTHARACGAPHRSVEIQPAELPIIVFRQCPSHHHNELWQQRRVRAPPVVPNKRSGRLAYYNNSKTMANSNVLQVILRDHGYERTENKDDETTPKS